MALAEACAVWIEQRVKEALSDKDKTGKSLRAIGRELSKEIETYFEVTVKPGAIKERARRMKSGTNVPPQPTNHNHSGKGNSNKIKRQKKTAKDGTMRGGKRRGAGRPKKNWRKEKGQPRAFMALGGKSRRRLKSILRCR